MSPFFLALVLLQLPFQVQSSIQCLQSPAAEYGRSRRPLNTECYTNWCKRVVGTTGVVEYDCDTQGDCARNSDNDPYDPYATQIHNCWSKNGLQICCCNTDYCNHSSHSYSLFTSILLLCITLFHR